MNQQNSHRVAVVTGAGSGVGRATALKFVAEGWRVALIGRRGHALDETIALAPAAARRRSIALSCDLADRAAVDAMAAAVLARFHHVDVLVNAAGTNVRDRSLGQLSRADYETVMGANIHGVLYTVQAFLPALRQHGGGTIVNIGSDAGLRASVKSGPAYVISKFGLTGLTQSINAEESAHGIRACCIFPGDIDTPLLAKRPVTPSVAARRRMLQPTDLAECVWFVAQLPARASVESLVIRPARPG